VSGVSWYDAVAYCNALSSIRGLDRCYACDTQGCDVAPDYDGTTKTIYDCPGFRLPTEAEWERAYRANTQTAFYNGDISVCDGADPNADKIGWYDENAADQLHPVARKQANAWGLFDLAGNLREWCHDVYVDDLGSSPVNDPGGPASGASRVWRGGSYGGIVRGLRAAFRSQITPEFRCAYQGFRCARGLIR
jgi:formylglycine-generating enzyme required for sulfatase activity